MVNLQACYEVSGRKIRIGDQANMGVYPCHSFRHTGYVFWDRYVHLAERLQA